MTMRVESLNSHGTRSYNAVRWYTVVLVEVFGPKKPQKQTKILKIWSQNVKNVNVLGLFETL